MTSQRRVEGEIKVSSKTLGHISAGLYRSPAGAIKELVTNAFDADATAVNITMNPPSFDVVTVSDNGSGMTFDKFRNIMEHQIGDSDKRSNPQNETSRLRPLIGRIGIGLLAIAQISHQFEVISHHAETRQAFRARVVLTDYVQDEIDAASENEESFQIGQYQMVELPYEERRAGTTIMATELKRGFVRRLRHSAKLTLPRTFQEFFTEIAKQSDLRKIGDYWKTTWALALASPLPYLGHGPVRSDPIYEDRQKRLREYDFRVTVDGMPLFRPVLLPPRENDQRNSNDMNVTKLEINEKLDGVRLIGDGYIYSQGGKSLYPPEYRGFLVRIKDVAIGGYDKDFLDYPYNEGPRLGWLSGEITIDSGLEDALNIDRDSFNETHPHYIAIQEMIHSVLDTKVRPWIYRNMDARGKEQVERDDHQRKQRLTETVAAMLPSAPSVSFVNEPVPSSAKSPSDKPPVRVNEDKGVIEVNESARWPRSKRNREIAERVAVAFEIALTSPDKDEMRRRFYQLLGQIFPR